MKILISLFLTVVCVHCIPVHEDGRGHYTEERKPFVKSYSGLDLNFAGKEDHKDGISVLKTPNYFGPAFEGYNDSVVKPVDLPADATTPQSNAGSLQCAVKCSLIQSNNPWAMQNSPSAFPNSPLPMPYNSWAMPYNPWAMQNNPWANPYSPWPMPNNPWAMQNSPWENPYTPFAMPNNPLAMQNSPWAMPNNPLGEPYNQWGIPNNQSIISKDAPDYIPSDMSQQKPSYVSTTEVIPNSPT